MRKDVSYSRPVAVDAGNAIDWEHPDNRGLVYLMGGYAGTQSAGGFVNNLVGSVPAVASLYSGAKWGSGVPGVSGIVCAATTAGAGLTTPNALRLAVPITIAASVRSNGSAPTAFSTIFGVTYGNTDVAPYASYAIELSGTGLIGSDVNDWTTINTQTASSIALTSCTNAGGARCVLVYTAAKGYLYINGIQVTTWTPANNKTPSYGANSLVSIGVPSYLARNLNATVWGGRIQNFAADASWVARDYQRHLNPTADDRLRWFSTRSYSLPSGSGSVASSSGTSTVSGVGASTAASVGSSTGTATSQATGAATTAGVGSTAGAATAQATGTASFAAIGSSTGGSTCQAVGASSTAGVGFSTGAATAQATGASAAASVGNSTGAATAQAVGQSTGSGAAVASSAGSSSASAVGAATVRAIFSAVGQATVSGISPGSLTADGRYGTAYDMGTRTASAVDLGSRTASAIDLGSRSVIGRAPN